MRKFEVFVDVSDSRWLKDIPLIENLVVDCQNAVIETVLHDVPFLSENKNFSINLALSDDQTVQKLNKEFRGMDKPTNVLSFANIDDDSFEQILAIEDDIELGDVIVAYETMRVQAEEIGETLEHHFAHLWVHGMLHILGYDHMEEQERLEMEAKEIKILSKLGVNNPYQE